MKETGAEDNFTAYMAHRWGSVFLRPLEETAVTLHDKHPQRMMRDMLKMTHQIFEPIRMSREEGSLSRSVTTRAPVSHLGRRKGGPVRLSRDLKGAASPLANGQSAANSQTNGSGLPSIAVEGEPVGENGVAETVDASGGAGVGTGSGAAAAAVGAKLQRRLGPSSARFNLTRGMSAPEMFSEVSSFKKKPVLEGDAAEAAGQEKGDDAATASTPGLLTTTGLKHAAGGERSSRSPLRQSMMATATSAEDVIEEDEEKEEQAEETSSVNSEQTRVEPRSQEGSEATTTEAATQDEAGEWKPVSGAEFEASGGGRKLERRRKNRQSGLGQPGSGSDSPLSVDGLSAESVLQALREEDP